MMAALSRPARDSWRVLWLLVMLVTAETAVGGGPAGTASETDPTAIRSYFAGQRMRVLTFLGYSGAGYENPAAMLDQVRQILDRYDPRDTLVNSGATAEGIGAVYALAKRKGFATTGIVSALARTERVPLAPQVDTVFYVRDAGWGGFLPGTETLSPTSQAMVENSDVLVAIGGGDVARDELIAARRQGKRVEFIPADMNHRLAREKARKKSQPAPAEFSGVAATAFQRPQ